MESQPKAGDLRVWWIPQVPMKAFRANVRDLREARLLIDTLADYDNFQFENGVRPDFANVGGLEVFDEESRDWIDWYHPETGDDFVGYIAENPELFR